MMRDRTGDSRLFTTALFDHTFDIDDVVTALCGSDHNGRWLLSTREGTLIREPHDGGETKTIADGDDEGYWHIITPLPATFLNELRTHYELPLLPADVRAQVLHILDNATEVADLPAHFDAGDETAQLAGGWLREQVKGAALEWLDARNMIPPSMRHVRDKGYSHSLGGGKVKVNIG